MKRLILVAALLASSAAQAFDSSVFDAFPPPPAAAKVESTLVPPRPIAIERIRPADSVPLIPYRNGMAMRVEVTVGGEKLLMLLDTGATASQIPKGMADRLIAAGKAWPAGATRVRLADGSLRDTQLVTIDTLVLGRHTVRNVRATISSEPLLSFPVLDGIGAFTVDSRSAQLIFHP